MGKKGTRTGQTKTHKRSEANSKQRLPEYIIITGEVEWVSEKEYVGVYVDEQKKAEERKEGRKEGRVWGILFCVAKVAVSFIRKRKRVHNHDRREEHKRKVRRETIGIGIVIGRIQQTNTPTHVDRQKTNTVHPADGLEDASICSREQVLARYGPRYSVI